MKTIEDAAPQHAPIGDTALTVESTPAAAVATAAVTRALSAGRTRITRELTITGGLAEELWDMYREAFEPLEERAVQQHLWSREAIVEQLANDEIVKFVGWADERPVGLCMITNNLDLVPMISPTFLRLRFPEHARRDAIFYGIMIFVRAGYRGRTMFAWLVTHMAQETALSSGVALFDMCAFNRERGSLDANLGRLARPFPGSAMSLVDQQSWFAIDFPQPLEPAAIGERLPR